MKGIIIEIIKILITILIIVVVIIIVNNKILLTCRIGNTVSQYPRNGEMGDTQPSVYMYIHLFN